MEAFQRALTLQTKPIGPKSFVWSPPIEQNPDGFCYRSVIKTISQQSKLCFSFFFFFYKDKSKGNKNKRWQNASLSFGDEHNRIEKIKIKTSTLPSVSSPLPHVQCHHKGGRSSIISPRTSGWPQLLQRSCRSDSHPEINIFKKESRNVRFLQLTSLRFASIFLFFFGPWRHFISPFEIQLISNPADSFIDLYCWFWQHLVASLDDTNHSIMKQ